MSAHWAAKQSRGCYLRCSRASHTTVKVLCKQRVAPRPNQNVAPNVNLNVNLEKLYADPGHPRVRAVGSVNVQVIAGKGRGLITTADVPHAELLLLCEPIGGAAGVAWAPEGASLRPPDLLAHWRSLQASSGTTGAVGGGTAAAADVAAGAVGGTVVGALSVGDRKRLALLYHGDNAEGSAVKRISLADFGKADVIPKPVKVKTGFGAPAKTSGAAPLDTTADELTDDRVEQVVALNSWGCEHGDFGVCGVSGVPSRAHIGVWPEFSLVNHSCVPNTVVFTVGPALVVRAAAPIPAGAEVTTSYIGLLGAAPVASRRRYLQSAYGFTCTCARCATESRQPAEVQAALDAAHAALENSAFQRVVAALAGGDADVLASCVQEAQRQVDAVEAVLDKHQVDPQVRVWLGASVYGWYELLAVCRSAGQAATDPALLEALVPLMEVIAPASDAHLYLCLEWLTLIGERLGAGHKLTEAAARPSLSAHLRRYGKVSDAMLTRLMTARGQVAHHMGRYDLAGQANLFSPAVEAS